MPGMSLREVYGHYTKASEARLQAMRACLLAIEAEQIAGDIVECGVWRGGNVIMARRLAPGRLCWLFDTFTGMPPPGELDRKPNGFRAADTYERKTRDRPWAAASLDEVRGYFAATGTLDEARLRFVPGLVEHTLRDPGNVPDRIALLRLDTDWHSSTKAELDVLYPRLASGGFLLVDDYNHWLGAKKAVDDYFRGSEIKIEAIDDTAVLIRRP